MTRCVVRIPVVLLTLSYLFLSTFEVNGAFAVTKPNVQAPVETIRNKDREESDGVESSSSPARTWAAAVVPSSTTRTPSIPVVVKDKIGSGSYGIVHELEMEGALYVGKRAWRQRELSDLSNGKSSEYIIDKEQRCRVYFDVEAHCMNKLPPHSSLATFYGVQNSVDGNRWMVFERIVDNSNLLARSLESWLRQEQADRREEQQQSLTSSSSSSFHHLSSLAIALGLSSRTSLTKVMDVITESLLMSLVHLHEHKIVHRDIKPGNILVVGCGGTNHRLKHTHNSQLVLIDFGSAADLDTVGLLRSNVGISERVAVSPIYTAPEVFIDQRRSRDALTFDCFSAALLFCQLLFQLYDEKADAGFHQQLEVSNYDLNGWLQTELQAKVAPVGLDNALSVLQERPGLWNLLQQMLQKDPSARISSFEALTQLRKIQQLQIEDPNIDGAFLADVLESMDTCVLFDDNPESLLSVYPTLGNNGNRCLQFVATFQRSQPLGLILSEADGGEDDDVEWENWINDAREKWKKATRSAVPGEVFVKSLVEGGQAEAMGVFKIGDRLQGVGEIPLGQGGFSKAVQMIHDQPKMSKFITLHFDRKRNPFQSPFASSTSVPVPPSSRVIPTPSRIQDQGAWSSLGRRKAQEDAFILHHIQDPTRPTRTFVLAGVCDGHLGQAASSFVRDTLPDRFSQVLQEKRSRSTDTDTDGGMMDDPRRRACTALEETWTQVCDDYRRECGDDDGDDDVETCSAEYDPRQGILKASTGSADSVAGTTATLVAMDEQTLHLEFVNCGDSRAIVVGKDSVLEFQTLDHTPMSELNRFAAGIHQGLDYAPPRCLLSKWVLEVGDYNYAVSRSLEGAFATSKGIISTPDVTCVQASPGMSVVLATDGLWEVMDSEEVCRTIGRLRYSQRMHAGDAAKTLCSLALDKGSKDNISAVLVYL